jgi:hypothetical protein
VVVPTGILHLERVLIDASKVSNHTISGLERLIYVWFELGLQVSLSISSSTAKNIVHASLFVCIVVGVRLEFAIHLDLPSVESWRVYPTCKD